MADGWLYRSRRKEDESCNLRRNAGCNLFIHTCQGYCSDETYFDLPAHVQCNHWKQQPPSPCSLGLRVLNNGSHAAQIVKGTRHPRHFTLPTCMRPASSNGNVMRLDNDNMPCP